MLDQMGNLLKEGDIVMFPDGNPRYGGLYIRFGEVIKLTEHRVTLETWKYEDGERKSKKLVNKTPKKLIKYEGKLA